MCTSVSVSRKFSIRFSSLFSDGLCGALEMASVDCKDSKASYRTDELNNMMLKKKIRVWMGKAWVFKSDMNFHPKQAHLKS